MSRLRTMNNIFINITKNLEYSMIKYSFLTDINGITSNFDNHINIKEIKGSFPNIFSGDFNFQEDSRENVKKEMINLSLK